MDGQKKHIVVIGGGPAGLMGAEVLATAGHRVMLFDRMPSLGRKFLMAGRGGLNLTHSESLETFLTRYGAATEWLEPSIRAFPPEALKAWCEGLGEETFIGTSGRVFPKSMKAAPLLRAWLRRLEQLGVIYEAQHTWRGWDVSALKFANTKQEHVFVTPDATLLALGGASWPRLGSDGGWVDILARQKIEVTPLRPSNSGFTVPWSEYFKTRFAGTPLKPVALFHDGMRQQSEIMITASGIEGGAVYALSAALREAIAARDAVTVHLDLRPGMSEDTLRQKLERRGNKSLSTHLQKAGFSPITVSLLRETMAQGELTALTAGELAARLKALPLTLTGTTSIARAISTAGGIAREALDKHFMLHARPSVFACGEMLDWEAPTGGYLLQGCFSTAVAAANGILRYLD
ncbi:MAG: TIGR03862 family flavoprotein [Rickettsiales bacterium]